jgi:hypothetical protein
MTNGSTAYFACLWQYSHIPKARAKKICFNSKGMYSLDIGYWLDAEGFHELLERNLAQLG